jgi:hypothetical protein
MLRACTTVSCGCNQSGRISQILTSQRAGLDRVALSSHRLPTLIKRLSPLEHPSGLRPKHRLHTRSGSRHGNRQHVHIGTVTPREYPYGWPKGAQTARVGQRPHNSASSAMMSALYSLFSSVRGLLWFIPALVKQLLGMKPREDEFAPQRMCPFCGLMTPRRKRHCLECGKSLKPA